MMALAVKYYKLFLNCGRVFYPSSYAYVSGPAGEWGTGSGKGGGSGGSIREAGGTFGKMEAAREEEYFRKLQSQQLSKLKKHMSDEISHYKRLIQQHKDAIDRLESHIREIKSQDAMKDDNSSMQG